MFNLHDNKEATKRFEKLLVSEFGDELDLDAADYWFNNETGKLVVNDAIAKRGLEYNGVKYDAGDVVDTFSF